MEHDNRDYADLERSDIAVYNFRGYTVIRFNKNDKSLEFGNDANICSFVPRDYLLMADFLDSCYQYSVGKIKDIEHVAVD